MEKTINRLSAELHIPKDKIELIYKEYWKSIKNIIETLPLKEDLSEEEFLNMKTSFNISNLGKFYCTYDRYKNIKEKYEHKEDKTSS